MKNIHQKLTQKYPSYHNWHQIKHHNKIHWGVFVGFALLMFGLLLNTQVSAQSFDTIAPTTPTNLIVTPVSSSQINLSWTASTDNVGVAGYKIFRDTTQIATTTWQATTYSDAGLTPSTTYTYTVSAYDAAGNESGQSNAAVANTLAPSDFTPPTVSVSFPVNNLAVAGAIPVSATASDNVGVAGVQFKLDGTNLGGEDIFAPYSTSWNTTQVLDGSYTLTAVARDAEGNTTTSSAIIARTDNIDNTGDYYDNRDGNHARLNLSSYPNVTYISSGYGGQLGMVTDKVVVGNSSTAYVSGEMWGSNVRVGFMRNSSGVNFAYSQYTNNNSYWYPEHRDHDETDYYFSQTPTVNSSQGSSGSELDEVGKWFRALAAFKPEVKELLKTNGLLMPTIQMIARRTRVASDEEYLSGAAHPNAFDNLDNRAQIEAMALGMEAGNVPPMVKIAVVEDGFTSKPTEDFFESGLLVKEKIYDTPVSIARAFRGREYTKRIVVSATDSFDLNSRPLSFHWKVLRGDPAHIQINLLNQEGSEAEILVDYHPQSVIEGSTRNTNLISVGVFAYNGVYYSAPAFVTSYTLNNEAREYDAQTKRLLKITYNSNYVDPYLTTAKSWEFDTYQYDTQGTLTGWVRTKAGQTYDFTKEGYLVTEKDSEGKVIQASLVSYSKDATTKKMVWQATGQPFDYPVITPPVLSSGSPIGTLPLGTTQTNLSVNTDENATCKYGIIPNTAYASITNTFTTTGGTTHSQVIIGLINGTSYNYYIRCQDTAENTNISDYPISFSVASGGISEAYFEFDYPPRSETFVIKLTDVAQIQHARNILTGKIRDTVHIIGNIIKEPAGYNSPWSYYLDSDSVSFFESATEVCDAGIQYVEDHLAEVGGSFLPGNSWCPWGSRLLKEVSDPTPPIDTQAPTIPAGLTAAAISSSQINLSWTASTDNVGVTGYKIYRNGVLLSTMNSQLLTYQDTGLQPDTTYTYTVSAYDAAGNESAKSTPLSVTTFAAFKQSDLNQDGKTDQLDFDILKQDFNRTDKPKSDLNQDGIVDSRDLGILMSSWGK